MVKKILLVIFCFLIYSNAYVQVNNKTLKAYILQVSSLHNKGEMVKQLDSLNKLKAVSPENSVRIKHSLAKEFMRVKKYAECLNLCYQGIAISKVNALDSFHIAFYRLLGNESYYTGKLPQAINIFKQALFMAEEKKFIELEAGCCQSIGGISLDLYLIDSTQKQQLDTSSKYLQLAFKKNTICGDKCKGSLVMTLRLLATLYDTRKEYAEACKLYSTVEIEAAALKDTLILATAFVAHANTLFLMGNVKLGTQKTEIAVDLMRRLKNRNDATYILVLKYLSKRRNDVGRYAEASALKSEIIELQESMYKTENQNQINELETQFKVKEIEQEKNIATANALTESQKKKSIFIILISVIVLVLFAMLLVYFRNKKKQAEEKVNTQKAIVTSILETEEKERSRIAKDLHDGIVQDLTAIKMNLNNSFNNASETLQHQLKNILTDIDAAAKEVREISYQMMPVTLRELGLEKAINELLNRSLAKNNIEFEFDAIGIENRLPEKIETTVYRICQELLNNTIKHSQATSVSLLLQVRNNVLQLTYEDNGVGFNATTTKKGIGLNSLNSRIEMVKGSLQFDNSETTGTTAYIRIPL